MVKKVCIFRSMSSLQIAQTTLIIGLIGIFVPTASRSLLHKFGKQYSFVVVENDHYLIIKSNPWFNLLKSISIFFVCSLLTISVAGNKSGTVYLQLVAIYAVSFVLAFIGFFRRMKFAIIID